MKKPVQLSISAITERRTERIIPVILPTTCVNVIRQVRKTYEGIDELALSVAIHGQQERGRVAAHTADQMVAHLSLFNRAFKSAVTLADLQPISLTGGKRGPELVFPALVYGHRRQRAVERAAELIAQGEVTAGKRYVPGYRAELHFNLSPEDALKMQFNENRHVQVPAHEEAQAAWDTFRVMRTLHVRYDYRALARDIGRTYEWTRGALRFCDELPENIQKCVTGEDRMPKLAYGVLVEIARLAEGYRSILSRRLSDREMLRWILDAHAEKLSTDQVGARVTSYLVHLAREEEGQGGLFDTESDEDRQPKHRRRKVAGQQHILGVLQTTGYLSKIQQMLDTGLLGPEDDPLAEEASEVLREYSPGSPVRMLLRLADRLTELAPRLEAIAKDRKSRLSQSDQEALAQLPERLNGMRRVARQVIAQEEDLLRVS